MQCLIEVAALSGYWIVRVAVREWGCSCCVPAIRNRSMARVSGKNSHVYVPILRDARMDFALIQPVGDFPPEP